MPLSLCACLLWLSTSGLWTVQAQEPNADTSMGNRHRKLAPNNVDFAFDLYKHLVASAPGENIFISPVSISMSLAMLSLGARGSTRARLLQGLGFNLTEMPEAKIHHNFQYLHHLLKELDTTMGNALFLNQSLELLESFSADAKLYYELDTLALDRDWAAASKQINEYIKNKTHEKNVNLFSELDSPAMLILVNYIFFKGNPTHPVPTRSHPLLPRVVTATETQSTLLRKAFCFTKHVQSVSLPLHPKPIRKGELYNLTKDQSGNQKS